MEDSAASVLSQGILTKVREVPFNFLGLRRFFGRIVLRSFYTLLTNTKIEGLENIPKEGPLLVLPNHLSNLDGPLVLGLYPHTLEMLGPRDFKMEPFKTLLMSVYGMTLIRRGYTDSEAVGSIIRHLRNGKHLLMFPSGGMWEKRDFSVKTGALYFSQLTQTPILPVGISGAYLQSHRTLTMHRPKLVLRFGEAMEPVSKKGSKREREELLAETSAELEKRMFALLEPEQKELYKRWQRESYAMEVEERCGDRVTVLHGQPAGFLPTLAEFAIKPNLFRPMWLHAKKNMAPFLEDRFFPAGEVERAASDLKENLTGTFSQYLPYRLGEEAQRAALEEIDELKKICAEAREKWRMLRLRPTACNPET
jgi:1-acyl-sn-glycerol-3-phosphate acyltransferase